MTSRDGFFDLTEGHRVEEAIERNGAVAQPERLLFVRHLPVRGYANKKEVPLLATSGIQESAVVTEVTPDDRIRRSKDDADEALSDRIASVA